MLAYKLRSGALLADAAARPGMLRPRQAAAASGRTVDTENVRRIFRLCEEPACDAAPEGR